jgi:hypothetical protein
VLPWEENEVPSVGKAGGDFYDNVYDVLRGTGKQDITPESVLEVMKVIERAKRGTRF